MAKLAINGGTRVRTQEHLPWPRATAEDEQAVLEVLRDSQWCRISADRAHEFERKFADFQGARYGVSLNSGTSALELGLLAMGLPPGGEVIVSPYTFMASVTSILVTRGVPVFVDIDPDTYNIDPDLIEAAITDRTFAIMAVHFGGRACDMQAILDIAKKHNLKSDRRRFALSRRYLESPGTGLHRRRGSGEPGQRQESQRGRGGHTAHQ